MNSCHVETSPGHGSFRLVSSTDSRRSGWSVKVTNKQMAGCLLKMIWPYEVLQREIISKAGSVIRQSHKMLPYDPLPRLVVPGHRNGK